MYQMGWTNRADFVIVGAQGQDDVLLLASKTLTMAQLQHELDDHRSLFGLTDFYLSSPRVTLEVEMPTYTLIKASTYQEAFAKLFQAWSPEHPNDPQKEIKQGQKSIPR